MKPCLVARVLQPLLLQCIKKSLQNKIFKPGVTTKDRGWGLGLSLAKRIIKEYHNGHIKIDESNLGIGTRILISMKVVI